MNNDWINWKSWAKLSQGDCLILSSDYMQLFVHKFLQGFICNFRTLDSRKIYVHFLLFVFLLLITAHPPCKYKCSPGKIHIDFTILTDDIHEGNWSYLEGEKKHIISYNAILESSVKADLTARLVNLNNYELPLIMKVL